GLIVAQAVLRVGANKNATNRSSAPSYGPQRPPYKHVDLTAFRTATEALAGEAAQAGIDLAGDGRTVVWQHLRHRQGAGAVERTDFQHPSGLNFLHYNFQEGGLLHWGNGIVATSKQSFPANHEALAQRGCLGYKL